MRMRRKVEGKSRVEAFDPSRFKGGGLIEGDFTVCVRPTPSPVMHERGGDRPAPDGSGGAVLGVVVAALLFDGGRQESVGAQSSAARALVAVGAASATPLIPERLVAAGKANTRASQPGYIAHLKIIDVAISTRCSSAVRQLPSSCA